MNATLASARLPPEPWRRTVAGLALATATAWAVLIWWAPHGLAGDRAGTGGRLVAAVAYVVGQAVCHQRQERSFTTDTVPQPVCARCAGLYLGAPLGVVVATTRGARRGRRPPARVARRAARRLVAWGVAPTLLVVALEWLQVIQPGNSSRFLLAIPAGAAVGWVSVAALLEQIDDPVE